MDYLFDILNEKVDTIITFLLIVFLAFIIPLVINLIISSFKSPLLRKKTFLQMTNDGPDLCNCKQEINICYHYIEECSFIVEE